MSKLLKIRGEPYHDNGCVNVFYRIKEIVDNIRGDTCATILIDADKRVFFYCYEIFSNSLGTRLGMVPDKKTQYYDNQVVLKYTMTLDVFENINLKRILNTGKSCAIFRKHKHKVHGLCYMLDRVEHPNAMGTAQYYATIFHDLIGDCEIASIAFIECNTGAIYTHTIEGVNVPKEFNPMSLPSRTQYQHKSQYNQKLAHMPQDPRTKYVPRPDPKPKALPSTDLISRNNQRRSVGNAILNFVRKYNITKISVYVSERITYKVYMKDIAMISKYAERTFTSRWLRKIEKDTTLDAMFEKAWPRETLTPGDIEHRYERYAVAHLIDLLYNELNAALSLGHMPIPTPLKATDTMKMHNNAYEQLKILPKRNTGAYTRFDASEDLLSLIPKPVTNAGVAFLEYVLGNPLSKPRDIVQRQNIIQGFINGGTTGRKSLPLKALEGFLKNLVKIGLTLRRHDPTPENMVEMQSLIKMYCMMHKKIAVADSGAQYVHKSLRINKKHHESRIFLKQAVYDPSVLVPVLAARKRWTSLSAVETSLHFWIVDPRKNTKDRVKPLGRAFVDLYQNIVKVYMHLVTLFGRIKKKFNLFNDKIERRKYKVDLGYFNNRFTLQVRIPTAEKYQPTELGGLPVVQERKKGPYYYFRTSGKFQEILDAFYTTYREYVIQTDKYVADCVEYYRVTYADGIHAMVSKVGKLDVFVAAAKMAIKNKYTRPVVATKESLGLVCDPREAFVQIAGLRHPIVAKSLGGKYIKNDVCMGDTWPIVNALEKVFGGNYGLGDIVRVADGKHCGNILNGGNGKRSNKDDLGDLNSIRNGKRSKKDDLGDLNSIRNGKRSKKDIFEKGHVYIVKWYHKGTILVGRNESGKSTTIRAVGLAVFMAQCGFWVPADYMMFTPYGNLLPRIDGSDNMMKGESTFRVELNDMGRISDVVGEGSLDEGNYRSLVGEGNYRSLVGEGNYKSLVDEGNYKSLVDKGNYKSLVIGDEICRGTDNGSADIIFAQMVTILSEENCNFLLSTHTNTTNSNRYWDYLGTVSRGHIDDKTRQIDYSTILQTNYGLECASKTTNLFATRDRLMMHVRYMFIMGHSDKVIMRKSKYTGGSMYEECSLCKTRSSLHEHHMIRQCDADENGLVRLPTGVWIHKDSAENIVVLCNKCHEAHHGSRGLGGRTEDLIKANKTLSNLKVLCGGDKEAYEDVQDPHLRNLTGLNRFYQSRRD